MVLGWAVVGGFGLLWLWALVTWIVRRREIASWFWGLLAALQVAVALQAVAGIVLLLTGARRSLLHYAYGAIFPVLVLVVAHVVARELEDERPAWHAFGWAGLICFGLTLRALMTGLSIG